VRLLGVQGLVFGSSGALPFAPDARDTAAELHLFGGGGGGVVYMQEES